MSLTIDLAPDSLETISIETNEYYANIYLTAHNFFPEPQVCICILTAIFCLAYQKNISLIFHVFHWWSTKHFRIKLCVWLQLLQRESESSKQ